jgi:hypothetical protein
MDGRRIDRIRFTPNAPVTGEVPVQKVEPQK